MVTGKPTSALRATEPDEAQRTTRGHEARQRGTPPATTKADGQVPRNNSRKPRKRAKHATNHGTGKGASQQ